MMSSVGERDRAEKEPYAIISSLVTQTLLGSAQFGPVIRSIEDHNRTDYNRINLWKRRQILWDEHNAAFM